MRDYADLVVIDRRSPQARRPALSVATRLIPLFLTFLSGHHSVSRHCSTVSSVRRIRRWLGKPARSHPAVSRFPAAAAGDGRSVECWCRTLSTNQPVTAHEPFS